MADSPVSGDPSVELLSKVVVRRAKPGDSQWVQSPPGNYYAPLGRNRSIGGNIGGLMAPILTGYILGATGSFVGALVFAGAMATFSACSMLFLVGHIGEEGDRMVLEN